jgi:dihydroorotate dehydrogenase
MIWKTGRSVLFKFPAEPVHHFSMGVFGGISVVGPVAKMFRRRYSVTDSRLQTNFAGLSFANPIGLAAGFDKEAKWFPTLSNLGFSHIEVGTLTGQAQPGNPKPRLFRLPDDQAIINRMGFNNAGADKAARHLAKMTKSNPADVLGINIGKTKIVPVESATEDYLFSFERLFAFADYFTVNVSSPNTPGLRKLQDREPLIELLSEIQKLNSSLAADHEVDRKPIMLKIAPDMTTEQLTDIVSIVQEVKLDALIATNTTISRDGLATSAEKVASIGNGGLSGKPLTERSRQMVSEIFGQTKGTLPIIGVGGIMTGEDAWRMIGAGASLIQLYTGFIYGGPGIVRDMNRYLLRRMTEHDLPSIDAAVGRDCN